MWLRAYAALSVSTLGKTRKLSSRCADDEELGSESARPPAAGGESSANPHAPLPATLLSGDHR